jgi:transcriptional regulator with XRE-family HTH domain
MSQLALVLDDTLKLLGLNQLELAEKAGVHRAQVNRASRGKGSTGAEVIQKIVRVLPEQHQGAVLAGWLKDQLAPDLCAKVAIFGSGTAIAETPTAKALPEGLDAETRDLILWLANQALHHTAVRDALRSLRRAAEAVMG